MATCKNMDLAKSDIRILVPKGPIQGSTGVHGFQDESPEKLDPVEQGLEDTAAREVVAEKPATAQEACVKGLVSRVFWPGTFTRDVMDCIKELASCNPVVLEESKTLGCCNMRLELDQANEQECEVLKKIWGSAQVMDSMLKYLRRKIDEL
ncbi:unnamed protein product [Rangifer tarandus platyrhynchus]|uniref:Uncharacterized protein n=1 Tax=Rangifer tarandus platyrhynchus TaxID=3082113 RepID=A0ACB1KI40_RANTA